MTKLTPEERRAYYRERYRRRLAAETPEEREQRKRYQRLKYEMKMAAETPEQREERLAKAREYYRQRVANETPEEKELRLAKAREDRLPPIPARAPAIVKEGVSQEAASESNRLVAVVRFSEDQQLRKKLLEEHYEEAIVDLAFFGAQEIPETSLSGSKLEALLRTIRHSTDRRKRDAALDELDQLGLLGTL